MVDVNALLKKAQEIAELKAEAVDARKRVAETYVLREPQDEHDIVTFERLVTDIESVRAAEALVENATAQFEEMANGRTKRRAKKARPPALGEQKPKASRGGLGRRSGLPPKPEAADAAKGA